MNIEKLKSEYITCELCKGQFHSISAHLKDAHPDISVEDYKRMFPEAPLLSKYGVAKIEEYRKSLEKIEAESKITVVPTESEDSVKKTVRSVFGISVSNKKGEEIKVSVLNDSNNTKTQALIPEVSDNYIFSPQELKYQLMALEMNLPCLVWGHKGTGKTEGIEQICARTNRAFMRVQHTANTEEAHIVGQWIVKNKETVYQLGALPLAMMHGWVYVADEYDFATPHVLSVYQSVLEGKPLVIKDAPEELRIIKPHKNFRFFATGNTNGTGDETGTYAGTLTQNSANYDRFGIVVHKDYLPAKSEKNILIKKTGITKEDANKLVDFASKIRKAYASGKVNDTISPRALINASQIGICLGDFMQGLRLSFTNKLTAVDEEIALQIAQRIFGNESTDSSETEIEVAG